MATGAAFRSGWRLVPDRTSLIAKKQTTPGVFSSATARECFRRNGGLVEAENSAGVYRFQREYWFVVKEIFPTQLGPGDILTLAATTNTRSPHYGLNGDYVILATDEAGALGAFKYTTTRPFLQGGLTDTISIYDPGYTPGAGVRNEITSMPVVAQSIAAKIHDNPPRPATETFGKLQIPNTLKCFLPVNVSVQAHSILVDEGTGLIYTITSVDKTAMLGVFQSLDLERHL